MIWTVSFFLAALLLFSAIALAAKRFSVKNKSPKHIGSLQLLTPICFVAAILLLFPAFLSEHKGETADIVKAFVLSVRKSIRLIGADEIYQSVFKHINLAPAYIRNAYQMLVLALQFFTPLLSFGLVLSFFKNLTAHLRYVCAYFKDIYAFAELNEKSLALATDILNNRKNATVVFADIAEKESGDTTDLIRAARSVGAVLFKKDITSVNFALHSKNRSISFFAMDDDEMKNVEHSLKLISDYNTRENTRLYIFSTGVEGELLLAGKEKGSMKVRRVDEVRSLISNFLYENGECIFESASPEANGVRDISAVIVGMGKRGTEMLKALSWYCQMDGYRITINAFDRDTLAEQRFSALCPELMSPQYNGVSVKGEAEYTIKVHSGEDVLSKSFADKFSAIKNATYIFVSLGSDELNIKTAVTLRMLSERMGIKPIITAVLSSSDAKPALESAKNNSGQSYGISFIGDTDSFYSERVIIDSKSEYDAFSRHCAYCDGDKDREEDFWRYEYCYRSSMASAIHAEARKKCGIAGAFKKEEELTDDEKLTIELLEHRRWNAYMRAEGYVYSGSPLKSSRNDLAKMHHNLVDYSSLSESDKRKDSRVGSNS